MSPNMNNYRNGASNQSKDHENHDSHEYLNLTHLQMRQKYSDKKSSPLRYGINDRVEPNINNGYQSTMGFHPPEPQPSARPPPPLPLQSG